MKLWEITFNRNTTKSVQINFQGSTLATNRDILDNSMFSSGDPVIPKAKKDTIYIVEISENIYLEEDESKNCQNYPNADYANYKDCDDQYMKDLCKGFDGFVPIWLTNDFEQVTKQGAFQCPGFHLEVTQYKLKLLQMASKDVTDNLRVSRHPLVPSPATRITPRPSMSLNKDNTDTKKGDIGSHSTSCKR